LKVTLPPTVCPDGDNVTVAVSVVEPPRATSVVAEVVMAEETTRRVSPVSPQVVETLLPLAAPAGW
jgi:hypothetical protein